MKSVLLLMLITSSLYAQTYSGGSGTALDPFLVSNKSDLKYLSENSSEWNKFFRQTSDINFVSADFEIGGAFYNAGEGFIPIGTNGSGNTFSGGYDGSNFVIDSLYINRPSDYYVGLFGYLGTGALISSVHVNNQNVRGQVYVGGIAGYNWNSLIQNCSSSGQVRGSNNVGGIAGICYHGDAINSSTGVNVQAHGSSLGGFVGSVHFGTIDNCYSTGNVLGTASIVRVGGFAGWAAWGIISNSYSSSNVNGYDQVGGFVGVTGSTGAITTPTVNCYSTGSVSGTLNTGGFRGFHYGNSTITNSFWDTQTSGILTSDGGTGKTTAEMKTQTTFSSVGWDLLGESTNGTDDHWDISPCDNNYPALAWQNLNLFSNFCVYVWTGNTSNDWGNSSNWSTNVIPGSNDSILIPTSPIGGVFPLTSSDITVTRISIQNGAKLSIGAGSGLIIGSSGYIDNLGIVVLQSSNLGTAWLDDFTNPNLGFSGNITVQRYITTGSGLGQRYFGSAVNNGTIIGLDGTYTGYPLGQIIPNGCDSNQLDVASPYSNLLEWHEDANFASGCVQEGWFAINQNTSLENARGYSGWMNDGSIIEVTGSPNSGPISYAATTTTLSGISNASGWHLLSNPYPSPMLLSGVTDDGFTSPQYYNASSGAYSGTFQPILVSGTGIPIMQGFVAQTSGNSFIANNTDRIATNNSNFYKNNDWYTYRLDIEVEVNGMADATHLFYDEDASSGFDIATDCKKMTSQTGKPTLFTKLNGEQMSLNGFDLESLGTSIELGLLAPVNGLYIFNFEGMETFTANTTIYLEDKLENTFHNVSNGSYSFNATSNYNNEDRFEIHFVLAADFEITQATCNKPTASLIELTNDNRTYTIFEGTSAIIDDIMDASVIELNPGSYVMTVYDQFGGAQDYAIIIDEVTPIEVEIDASATYTEVLTDVFFEAVSNATNYTWEINGTEVSNTPLLTFSFTSPGIYNIRLEAKNETCNKTDTEQITVLEKTTSIIDLSNEDKVQIYPLNGELVVDFYNYKSSTAIVSIFNLLGQEITSKTIPTNGTQKITIPNISDGYYLVKITSGETSASSTILIKR